jgi:hypothetical protein
MQKEGFGQLIGLSKVEWAPSGDFFAMDVSVDGAGSVPIILDQRGQL